MDVSGSRTATAGRIERVTTQLRTALERLYGARLRGLYLYGSCARGEATEISDVDLLVVLDRMESYWDEIVRTSSLRSDLSLEHARIVSLVFLTEADWLAGDTPFLANVREEARAA